MYLPDMLVYETLVTHVQVITESKGVDKPLPSCTQNGFYLPFGGSQNHLLDPAVTSSFLEIPTVQLPQTKQKRNETSDFVEENVVFGAESWVAQKANLPLAK